MKKKQSEMSYSAFWGKGEKGNNGVPFFCLKFSKKAKKAKKVWKKDFAVLLIGKMVDTLSYILRGDGASIM